MGHTGSRPVPQRELIRRCRPLGFTAERIRRRRRRCVLPASNMNGMKLPRGLEQRTGVVDPDVLTGASSETPSSHRGSSCKQLCLRASCGLPQARESVRQLTEPASPGCPGCHGADDTGGQATHHVGPPISVRNSRRRAMMSDASRPDRRSRPISTIEGSA
jgi:hypothetical protein